MSGQWVREKIMATGVSLAVVARRLGITPQSLHERLGVRDMKVSVLVEIAGSIDKDLLYFFDDERAAAKDGDVNPAAGNPSGGQKTIRWSAGMEQLVQAKDEVIDAQRKTISAYERILADMKKQI